MDPGVRRRTEATTPIWTSCLRDSVRLRLASRRSGGHLSLRWPRLEPDHRPGPGGDRSPAAHVLDRVRGPALRRALPSGGGGARDRHPPPRGRRGTRRDRRRVPRGGPARRDAAGAHGAGAAVPARQGGARARRSPWSPRERGRTSSSGATSCSRRSRSASSTSASRSARSSCSSSSTPTSGPAVARRGPAWRRFLLETGADDEELGSHLTRAEATSTVKAFYRPEVAAEIGKGASLDRLRAELPPAF